MIKDIQFWRQRFSWPFRRKIKNTLLRNKTVVLDYLVLDNVHLIECDVVYHGMGPINARSCTFDNCAYSVSGPAGNTLNYLSIMFGTNLDLFEKTFPFQMELLKRKYEKDQQKVQDPDQS